MTYNCAHCGKPLLSSPEREAGDWVIRCLACGARNIIIPVFKLAGWR
jgi:DNA-directed RNA polymerase subunit RPC12/RpoP